MIYRGTVRQGVVELEDGAALPDGTHVNVEPVARPKQGEATGWPPGYFDQTFGSISDETFMRPPQGELPEAVDLE